MSNGQVILVTIKLILGGMGFGFLLWIVKDWWDGKKPKPEVVLTQEERVREHVRERGIFSLTHLPPSGISLEEVKKSFDLIPIVEQTVREQIDAVVEAMDEENLTSVADRVKVNDDAKRLLAVLQNYHLGDVGQLKDMLKEQLTYLAEDILEANSRIARFNTHNPETRDYE